MFKQEVLENENRRKAYCLIESNQGIHFRELQRLMNIPATTLEYHLSYMVRKKIAYAEKEGQFRRYYTKPLDEEDKKILSALRQKKIREVVLFIIASEKAKYQSLSDNLKLPYSTLSFYLKYLVDRDILLREKIGYETIYTVRDPDRVAKVLIAYKSGFLDKMVDKALNVWLESYSSKDAL